MYKCPVCNYSELSAKPYANIDQFTSSEIAELSPPYEGTLGKASYEVCPQCGFEYGNDDNPGTAQPQSFAQYRSEWKNDEYRAQQQYVTNVKALVQPFLEDISPEAAKQISSLIDHGESPEGVNSLAWAIVSENIMVSAETVAKIREYTADLVAPEHMPANLDDHIAK